ncbi:MAG: TIR domain-containing protein [Planctomycetota bacterium]|jgi:WD40 repeat protein/SAM-dependent methyltransferase
MGERKKAKKKVAKKKSGRKGLRARKVPGGFELLHTLRGHKGVIFGLAWSPDGRFLVSGSGDKTIKVWEGKTGRESRTLKGHSLAVNSVAVTPDGRRVVSASDDYTLKVWDPDTRTESRTLEGHSDSVYSVAVTPDGRRAVSGSRDKTLKVWDLESGREEHTLKGHSDFVSSVAVTPDGGRAVSGSTDGRLKVWDLDSGEEIRTLKGHTGLVYSVAVAADGGRIASGSNDNTIRIWDIEAGRELEVLEGHGATVKSIGFSADGRLLRSKSDDRTVRVWRCDDWECVAVLSESSSALWVSELAFHPREAILATLGEMDTVIRIWKLDYEVLLGEPGVVPSVRYSNAKVVLVGESGVGKTGLGLVLSGQEYRATDSTHKRNVWTMAEEIVQLGEGKEITRETLLWDLAGQPGYRIIHQLSLTETAVALVVFDARSETDPFAGVAHWNKALRQAQAVSGENAPTLKKYLVAARTDRGGVAASQARIDRIVEKYGFDGYIATSAKEGTKIGELIDRIKAGIDWENLPSVSSTELFQGIKKFIIGAKEAGRLICSVDDLYREFINSGEVPAEYEGEDLGGEFRTCVGLVEGRGLIRRLNFGGLLLLQPELLDAYAACLTNAAKAEPDGLGCIAEEDARQGRFAVAQEDRIGDAEHEKLLLIAMVEDLLRHEIGLRENEDLVLPSQFTRENPELPNPEGKEVVFRFEGAVMNIYATLVVRLAHSEVFSLRSGDMWRNAAVFRTGGRGRYGLALTGGTDEGWGDLTLFYQEDADDAIKAQFEDFVEAHLKRRALGGSVHGRRIIVCSGCATPVSDIVTKRAKERGKKEIRCQVCDGEISLVERERVAAAYSKVLEMDRQADAGRDRAAAATVIEGKLATNDFDVFLCHNSEDQAAFKEIGERLKERAILAWLDIEQIPPGRWFQDVIQEAIPKVKSAAVVIGKKGLGRWEAVELRAFISECVERKLPVIPVLLPGVTELPKELVFLKEFSWIGFCKRVDEVEVLDALAWGITGERGRGGGMAPSTGLGAKR